jgi:signal transduction histidine kinase
MKNKSPLDRKIQLAFGSAILTLLVVGVISYHAMAVSSESDRWVRHTHEVLESLQDLLSSMQDLESSSRGFVLTGKESYLETYRASISRTEQEKTIVTSLTVDNPAQRLQIPKLERLAAQEIQLAGRVIDLRRTNGLEAAVDAIQNGEGQRIMEDYRELIREMEDDEQRLLVLRDAVAKRRLGQTRGVLILGTLLGLFVAVAAGWSVQRDSTQRLFAEESLLQKVEELNRSNEELQQFAYIASHDLQEPLRMVASYTQLLSRRYKGKLDSNADEFISFAVDGASRMQRLIKDLLAYSRVGTKAMDLLDTSSEEALQQALINLRGAAEESGAQVTHDPLPIVVADEMQLIQLFQNLVGNAIKYQNPGVPRVHISAARNGEKRWTFSVRDNGLGIDSQYFERIFGMFQRLHKREEFEGTGVGLAICKKIVERHGGSISVESQLGHGSTFRFALAGSEQKSSKPSEESVCP